MKRKFILEQITFDEYNRLCNSAGLPKANSEYGRDAYSHHEQPNFHAIVKNAGSSWSDFRMKFQNIFDITAYLEKGPFFVACIHPCGKWGISESERRTATEGRKYIEVVQGMDDVESLVLRIGRRYIRRNYVPNSAHGYHGDTLSFQKWGSGLSLQRVSIHNSNFDMYDFGDYNNQLTDKVPFVRAIRLVN